MPDVAMQEVMALIPVPSRKSIHPAAEAERAQRWLDRLPENPAALPLDNPARLLHDLLQVYRAEVA